MICPETGKIRFNPPLLEITPDLTRTNFLASEFGKSARTLVANEPWHSWALNGTFESLRLFSIAIFFKGEKLESIQLEAADPAFGTSWDDYTPEKSKAQQAAHDEWVTAWLGHKRKFSWGTVWSGYDQKGGFASISIRYN